MLPTGSRASRKLVAIKWFVINRFTILSLAIMQTLQTSKNLSVFFFLTYELSSPDSAFSESYIYFFYKISHPRSSQTTYLIGYFFTTSPIEMQLSSEGKYMILYLLYFGFFILENNCFKRNNSLICPQKIIKNISIKYKFKI